MRRNKSKFKNLKRNRFVRATLSSTKPVAKQAVKEEVQSQLNPTLNKLVRAIGGVGGKWSGIGSELGSELGNEAHKVFKNITGWGDYQVQGNSLMSQGAPIFKTKDRIMNIRHREFIGDTISSSTAGAFTLRSLPINPSNSTLFPWLSTLASNFQQYRFKGLIFSFQSNSGNSVGSVNTSLGTVIMSTNYNVHSPSFTNKQQMETHEFTTSCKPSVNMIHPIECSPKEQVCQHYFIKHRGINENGEDKKFYDIGNFEIATVGMQGTNVNLGELWVSYDVELLKPRKDHTKLDMHFQCASADLDTDTMFKNGVIKYGDVGIVTFSKTDTSITFDRGFYGTVRLMSTLDSPGGSTASYNITALDSSITYSNTFHNDTSAVLQMGDIYERVFIAELDIVAGGKVTFTAGSSWFTAPDALAQSSLFITAVAMDDSNL